MGPKSCRCSLLVRYCSLRQWLDGGADVQDALLSDIQSPAFGVAGRNGHRALTRVASKVPRVGTGLSTTSVGLRGALGTI